MRSCKSQQCLDLVHNHSSGVPQAIAGGLPWDHDQTRRNYPKAAVALIGICGKCMEMLCFSRLPEHSLYSSSMCFSDLYAVCRQLFSDHGEKHIEFCQGTGELLQNLRALKCLKDGGCDTHDLQGTLSCLCRLMKGHCGFTRLQWHLCEHQDKYLNHVHMSSHIIYNNLPSTR